MASETNLTVIASSATFRGELTGDSDVRIDGTLEGSVRLPSARIMVGPDANVRALLSAKEIIVHGRVEGELRSTGLTELRASASVTGDIFTVRLSVEEAATLHGQVNCMDAEEEIVRRERADATKAGRPQPEVRKPADVAVAARAVPAPSQPRPAAPGSEAPSQTAPAPKSL